VVGCMHFAGVFSIISNSRMIYAFTRNGGIPGSPCLTHVNQKWKSPIRTGYMARAYTSFILGQPSLGSTVAFSAATSIAPIGLYISYGMLYVFTASSTRSDSV
ncbi:hypothetical protein CYLTODRAFT_361277, partial [Cylindrobasidium torrendii FP15055 ss-10]